LLILQGNSCSVVQKSDVIWIVQTDLPQIYPKLDRLLDDVRKQGERSFSPSSVARKLKQAIFPL
jgi:hypothetical protein